MRTHQTLCKLTMTILAALAVSAMGTGCSEEEMKPPATSTAPPSETAVQPAPTPPAPPEQPVEAPKPPVQPTVTETPKPPTVTETPKPPAGEKAAFDAFAKKASVPAAFVPKVSAAPKVDGQMDEIYKQATPLVFKDLTGAEDKPAAKTTAYVVSTDTTWYILIRCESPDMDALLADVREHDGSVWNDDSIEIFIDPSNKRQIDTYMHMGVNALATTMEAKGPKGDEDYSWDPKLTVKTKVGKKDWTVELAIPFSELVGDVKKLNKVWAVNFNRMAYLIEGTEDTAWSPTGGTDSHVPSKFGALWFQAGKVDNSK